MVTLNNFVSGPTDKKHRKLHNISQSDWNWHFLPTLTSVVCNKHQTVSERTVGGLWVCRLRLRLFSAEHLFNEEDLYLFAVTWIRERNVANNSILFSLNSTQTIVILQWSVFKNTIQRCSLYDDITSFQKLLLLLVYCTFTWTHIRYKLPSSHYAPTHARLPHLPMHWACGWKVTVK